VVRAAERLDPDYISLEREMAAVHDFLAAKGKQGAVEAGFDRSVVEVAAAYLSDEESGLGFAYSGWAQCALPHKRLPKDAAWGERGARIGWLVLRS
jgi:hypothetical protein